MTDDWTKEKNSEWEFIDIEDGICRFYWRSERKYLTLPVKVLIPNLEVIVAEQRERAREEGRQEAVNQIINDCVEAEAFPNEIIAKIITNAREDGRSTAPTKE